MKLLHKRILILFSVALNIGFVVVALSMAVHHSRPFHERSWLEVVDIVDRLDLPRNQQADVLETIKVFRSNADKRDKDIKEARKKVLLLLAQSGPLDTGRLQGLIEAVRHQEEGKSRVFEDHVVRLRSQLGDEKGALFFTYLIKHLEAKHRLLKP